MTRCLATPHDGTPPALYGEDMAVPFVPHDVARVWRLALLVNIGQTVSRAYVVTMHGSEMLDASRHDL